MAITGSGSLAISLSVFVISAAFLPKGEFFGAPRVRVCVCGAELPLPRLKPEEDRGEVVVRLRARCAQASPEISASLSVALTPEYPRCFWRALRYLSLNFTAD